MDSLDAFHDPDRILRQAAATFFDHLSQMCEGILLVDRQTRIVWINDRYERYLKALGFESPADMVGQRVEDAVPNTLMHQVVQTGQPILLDILENKAGTYVVSRIPLRDDAGTVIGAVGLILYDQIESLRPLVDRVTRLQRELAAAQRELAQQRRTQYTFSSFVGASAAALDVKRRARRAAVVSNNVLLLGETGTGKELVAQAIHAASSRGHRPFIAVNVAAIPDTLLETEFFGVAPGAYTGADRRGRDGKFRLADGGTLFLDEIGDMPLALQSKLLRVLEERVFEPVGSNDVIAVDVRVIAATSRDLEGAVQRGEFRADLYYRLNVLPIRLPPLRERPEDLGPLAEHLLERIAAEHGIAPRELDPAALAGLAELPWPGNVRELRNVLEQASLFTDALRLTRPLLAQVVPALAAGVQRSADGPAPSVGLTGSDPAGGRPDLAASAPGRVAIDAGARARVGSGEAAGAGPSASASADNDAQSGVEIGPGPGPGPGQAGAPGTDLPAEIARLEARMIRDALRATGGNRVQAARRLRIARATLYQKIGDYDELSEFRTSTESVDVR